MSTVDYPSATKHLEQLPGPRALPLLGNVQALRLSRLHATLEAWAETYGLLYRFQLGPKTVLVVSDPETTKEILRERPHKYRRVAAIESAFEEMGTNGVFSREGEAWQRQRRITMQAFQPQHLRAFLPTMKGIAIRLRTRWQKLAQEGVAFNATRELTRYTLDIVTAFALGHDLHTLEGNEDSIHIHLEKMFPEVNRRVGALFPYWRYVKLPADYAFEASLKQLRVAVEEFISKARASLTAEPDRPPRNFLEAMINARDEDGTAFSDQDIVANALTILLGGEDTSANTLAWILYFLRDRPDVLKKMQDEVDQRIGSDTDLTNMELLESLPYLDAVVQEAMRLKPVAPVLFLESVTEVAIKGYFVPARTPVFLAMRPAALDSTVFPESAAFRPERWLEPAAPETIANQRRVVRPFGGGPRFCPGRTLALLEIKHALIIIAQNFNVLGLEVDLPVREIFNFAMMPENVQIRLEPRTRVRA